MMISALTAFSNSVKFSALQTPEPKDPGVFPLLVNDEETAVLGYIRGRLMKTKAGVRINIDDIPCQRVGDTQGTIQVEHDGFTYKFTLGEATKPTVQVTDSRGQVITDAARVRGFVSRLIPGLAPSPEILNPRRRRTPL